MADITINHTRAEGTLVDGSSKGDGVYQLMSPYGFRYSRTLGQIYLPHSRDKRAQTWRIDSARDALKAAGHTVTVEIDETQARSFAEAEEERNERAVDRALSFGERAGRAASQSEADWAAGRRLGQVLQGEPIKVGHHSEGRHRRDLARMDTLARRSIDGQKKADYLQGRADASAHYEQHRTNPARTLRRIEKLQADVRGNEREQQRAREVNAAPSYIEELERRHAEYTEQIAYWQAIVDQAVEEGFKVWGKGDFTKGDFVRVGGRWYEVLRVNTKTLTVPGGPDPRKIITQATRQYSWDARLPYDGVTGRIGAEEMAQKRAEAAAQQPGETVPTVTTG
ncbi:DUF3560 domain-containing protein [Streptomyces sp. NPDC006207]